MFDKNGREDIKQEDACAKLFVKEKLGSGGQGDVYSALLPGNKKVAAKCVRVLNNPQRAIEVFCNMYQEFQVTARFSHPGIVETFLFFWRQSKRTKGEIKFFILSELMEGGHLLKFMQKQKQPDFKQLKNIVK